MTERPVDKPPVSRRRIIERPRLTRLLDESPARIKMLVAPAGYGKTTLARQWLEHRGLESAWFPISRVATDIAVIALGIARACSAIVGDADVRLRERLSVTHTPDNDVESLSEILVRDLIPWPDDAWLVIDDLHNVRDGDAADAFMTMLAERSNVNLLLCTRRRPTWVGAREVLYGSILEIGRSTLAMTRREADAVLGGHERVAPGLIELAEGWPAVVGLASLSSTPLVAARHELALPETLYNFLAEELYQALVEHVRRALCELTLSGVRSRSVAADLLRDVGGEVALDAAIEAGWLSTDPRGGLELHPLLEAFLRAKIDDRTLHVDAEAIERIALFLVEHEAWDEAFTLIEQYGVVRVLQPLVSEATDELLSAGRTSTLRRWTSYGAEVNADFPELAFLSAELSVREGKFVEAESFGRSAADALDSGHHWKCRAYMAAGRAAHASNREEAAFQYYRCARDVARTPSDQQVALLGEVSAAIDLELPEAHEILAGATPAPEEIDAVVLHMCRVLTYHQRFGVPLKLEEPRRVAQLLPLVRDPITRCSFRNAYGYTLAGAGERSDVNDVVAAQLADAAAYRLDFVVPYVWLLKAVVASLENDLDVASYHIDKLERSGRSAGDGMLVANALALRARCLIASGDYVKATSLSLQTVSSVTKAMAAELVACRALALACDGDLNRALDTAGSAEAASRCTEVQVLVASARAIAAIRRGDAFSDHASRALDLAMEAHCIECFAAAYRGFPQLASLLLGDSRTREATLRLLVAASDSHRLSALDANTSSGTGSWMSLSPREREVLLLVSHGKSNREIGRALFISEATVKVHVRHIFEKLGVRSRTQAALRIPQYASDEPRSADANGDV